MEVTHGKFCTQRPWNIGAREISVPERPANLSQKVLCAADWAPGLGAEYSPAAAAAPRGTDPRDGISSGHTSPSTHR